MDSHCAGLCYGRILFQELAGQSHEVDPDSFSPSYAWWFLQDRLLLGVPLEPYHLNLRGCVLTLSQGGVGSHGSRVGFWGVSADGVEMICG